MPLQSVSVSGQIKGYVAGLDVDLCFHNSSDGPLEVLFRFPVDEAMAVVGLEAKIDGRTIKGVVSMESVPTRYLISNARSKRKKKLVPPTTTPLPRD